MSEHSESPTPAEKRRLNGDTISSLPRKSFQVNMTGGIVYQGQSCATLATQNSSDNDESFVDEDGSPQSMEKVQRGENRRKGRVNRQLQLQHEKPTWKHMDEEGAIVDPESNSNSSVVTNPMNISTDSTMGSSQDSSVQEFGELASDGKKAPSQGRKLICGLTQKKLCFVIAAVTVTMLMVASIPTIVLASKEALATQAPSQSMFPSAAPSLSTMPSDEPSLVPTHSMAPSSIPSDLPSTVPSIVPTNTFKPSQRPSNVPSLSLVPSLQPSESPSASPTKLPSVLPSVSMEPTFTPIDPNWRFKLRLYWEVGYFWQEEADERFWCLECVPCAEYGRDDGWKHGCEAYPDGLNTNCKEGDSVWIRDCRKYGNEYNVLQKHKAGFTLRLHNTNLCIERRNKHLMMKRCNIHDPDQQFVAWDDFSKFELRPLAHAGWTEREADCVSQLHHPKSDEVVGMHNCRLCRHFETRYWEVYK